MYLNNIKIKNYGGIKDLQINARFDENGNPVPIILIGKNGSGKSLLLANIVDSLIEIKRKIYPQHMMEVKENNYYKVGKKGYINMYENFSFVEINYLHNSSKITYHDIMARDSKDVLEAHGEIQKIVRNNERFKNDGFYRSINKKLDEEEFNFGAYLYFPVDRYYVPNWFNEENYVKINYDEDERFVGNAPTNMIKNNVINNIKNWLYGLFLSRRTMRLSINGNIIDAPVNTPTQQLVLNVLNVLKPKQNLNIPTLSYKNHSLPISGNEFYLSDVNNLSSGEIMMLSLFVSVIKEYDIYHDVGKAEDVVGICVIDEIDLNLHISQQRDVLPLLIKMFPKVQFIITTHSPFFVKGMKDSFNDDCDVIMMPDGERLNDILEFSEIEESIKIFDTKGEEFINAVEELKSKISKSEDKVIIITEGKTDAKFIQKAYKKLGGDMTNIEFRGLEGESGDIVLRKFLESQKEVLGTEAKKIIGIFDHDNPEIIKWLGDSKYKTIIENKVYAFCIPIPNDRIAEDFISIEHYFNDDDLNIIDDKGRKLYQAKEFISATGINHEKDKICTYIARKKEPIRENYILSGSSIMKVTDFEGVNNYSLSKNEFCEYVCNEVKPYDNVDFSNFKLIADLINEILSFMK